MNALSESEQARVFAGEVDKLIGQFKADGGPDSQQSVDYLILMRAELLEFADNPAEPRLRRGVEEHIKNFIGLAAQAKRRAG
ncbi:hypothetical protein [Streptomyces luteireticuli]|uniref:hypothetical protein n=1 Tax=Streptomyces luteireticuli TaxID=173858 RepID=UPI0035575CD1